LELVEFLKKDLKNDSISLEINVNKLKEKKFVFTPGEKYEKLKKNKSQHRNIKKRI